MQILQIHFVAKQIAEYAKNENYDIILTGKAINYNGSQIGGTYRDVNTPFVSLQQNRRY